MRNHRLSTLYCIREYLGLDAILLSQQMTRPCTEPIICATIHPRRRWPTRRFRLNPQLKVNQIVRIDATMRKAPMKIQVSPSLLALSASV